MHRGCFVWTPTPLHFRSQPTYLASCRSRNRKCGKFAQHHRNTVPQYILHQRRFTTTVGTRIWDHLQLLLPHHRHVIQMNHKCKEAGPIAVLHSDVGGLPTGDTTTLDQVDGTLHLLRVTPKQMRVLQRAGTHHIPFLQHPNRPNKSVLENHQSRSPTTHRWRNPKAYNLFWSTHKQPIQQSCPTRDQAHRTPGRVGYVPETTVPAVLQLAPNGLKVTLRSGKAQGNLWMLPSPTARKSCPPLLPQDALTGIATTGWRCGPHALATPWAILQLLARHHHTRTAHAAPEQHRWLHTHFQQARADMSATVTW